MRGEIIYKVLSFFGDEATTMVDFMEAFLRAGYGAGISRIDYEFDRIRERRTIDRIRKERTRKIQKYLSKLDKEKFIVQNASGKIRLTLKGKSKLQELKKSYSLNKPEYKKEDSQNVILVSYDIPVIFNKERNIVRDILKSLDFRLVHKSVWVGKTKLPKELILYLEKLSVLDYVEILEVTKTGSLKSLH